MSMYRYKQVCSKGFVQQLFFRESESYSDAMEYVDMFCGQSKGKWTIAEYDEEYEEDECE